MRADLARSRLIPPAIVLALLTRATIAAAGSFNFVVEGAEDRVTHPNGYTGAGASLTVTVCIDPSSLNAASMQIPTRNAIDVWNGLAPQTGNVDPANVPFSSFDFETVVLHEMGHCIGLGHPNLGALPGLTLDESEYTLSTDGAASFDLGIGADNEEGSADDVRGDDDNLHYFRISNNDPFTIGTTVDSTTYSRSLGSLPVGDSYAANCDRDVAMLAGHADTECAMQQGLIIGESKRTLGHDDVATARYAMSGIDELESTADDYSFQLSYVGLTASCDVILDFDDTQTSVAVCLVGGTFIGSQHIAITQANIYFNSGTQPGNEFDWFFNPLRLGATLPGLALPGLGALAMGMLGLGARLARRRV